MRYWVIFQLITPDNKSRSSILKVVVEKNVLCFPKILSSLFLGFIFVRSKNTSVFLPVKTKDSSATSVVRKSFFEPLVKPTVSPLKILSFCSWSLKSMLSIPTMIVFFAVLKMFEGNWLHEKYVRKLVLNAKSNLTDTFVRKRFGNLKQNSRFATRKDVIFSSSS